MTRLSYGFPSAGLSTEDLGTPLNTDHQMGALYTLVFSLILATSPLFLPPFSR